MLLIDIETLSFVKTLVTSGIIDAKQAVTKIVFLRLLTFDIFTFKPLNY